MLELLRGKANDTGMGSYRWQGVPETKTIGKKNII